MIRVAVSLPPSAPRMTLPRSASGISAVSALDASAIARSKPAIFWKRLTTRSTNAGRSQNVARRRRLSRSTCGMRSLMPMIVAIVGPFAARTHHPRRVKL